MFCFYRNNRNKLHRIVLVAMLLVVTICIFNSCIKKEDFDMDRLASGTYEPAYAIPLAHSTLTMWDILKDYDSLHLVEEDSTHFLTLVYRGEKKSNFGENAIDFTDTTFITSTDFSIPGNIPSGGVTLPEFTESFIFNTPNGDERFDSVVLRSGNIDLNLTTDLNHNATIEISIPSILRDGVPVTQTLDYVNGQASVTSTIDLSNSTVVFEHPTQTDNQISVGYTITVFGTGNPNNSPYNFTMEQSFRALEFSILYGYLGQPDFIIDDDSVFVNIFSHHIIGALDFRFKEPKLILDIENSIGLPAYLDVQRLVAYSHVNDSVEIDIDSITIPSPTVEQVGEKAITHREYTNIDEAVNISPQYLIHQMKPVLNPAGYQPGMQNFILDTSNINIKAQIELPLWGTINQFVLQDTFEFQFDNYKEIDWLEFKIVAENSFPVDAKIQMYFVDSSYNILDSVIQSEEQVIEAGIPSSPNGEVVYPRIKITIPEKFVNSTERSDRLEKTRYFFIRGDLNTVRAGNTQPEVKFFGTSNLTMKVGLRVQLKTDFTLNE